MTMEHSLWYCVRLFNCHHLYENANQTIQTLFKVFLSIERGSIRQYKQLINIGYYEYDSYPLN